MGGDRFRVQQLDHVELFVPDRREAAAWFEGVLGLTPVPECAHWADDPHGPLMISPDGGNTKLALFAGEATSSDSASGFDQVAFRVDGTGFLQFVGRIETLELRHRSGRPLTAGDVRDHHGCYSVHFVDPWGHRFEVTTYDCDYVAPRLPKGSI